MNWLDVLILVVLGWFVVTSLFTGLIREVLNLVGLVAGVFLAGRFFPQVAKALTFIADENVSKVVAFLLIFLVVGLGIHLVGSLLQQVVDLLFLGWADHLGGAAFGFLKGFVIVEIGLFVVARFPILGLEGALKDSAVTPLFLKAVPILLLVLPKEFDAVRGFLT